MDMSGQLHALATFLPGKEPLVISVITTGKNKFINNNI
jgi:hypothetical protein